MSEGELRLYKDLINAERVSHIDFKLIAKKLFDELQQKENIIKEVREYITKQVHRNQQFYEMDIENILQILDKEK